MPAFTVACLNHVDFEDMLSLQKSNEYKTYRILVGFMHLPCSPLFNSGVPMVTRITHYISATQMACARDPVSFLGYVVYSRLVPSIIMHDACM